MAKLNEKSYQINIQNLEKRLECLEKLSVSNEKHFKYILKVITIIFIVASFILAAFQITSKIEVSNAIQKMWHRFDMLSGQALKKPSIDIYYKGKKVTGGSIEYEFEDPSHIPISEFYIHNYGDKTAENICIKFYFSQKNIIFRYDENMIKDAVGWEPKESPYKEYTILYELYLYGLTPKDEVVINSFDMDLADKNIETFKGLLKVLSDFEEPIELEITFKTNK